jgi:hypothetical protein
LTGLACSGARAQRPEASPAAPSRSAVPAAPKAPPFINPQGLYLPEQVPAHAETLKSLGLTIDPKELSDPLSGVLSAIVNLSGCSASFVSDSGLIATNHHCALAALQHNSTPENDRLKNGHLSRRREHELPSGPSVRVFVTRAFRDVSAAGHAAIVGAKDDLSRARAFEAFEKATLAECERDRPEIRCELKNSYHGLKLYLVERIELRDVRIVYAPPEGIGDFGGEVDNWRWPRHAGDFAFFRAYTGADGKPADYAPGNVPYRPAHFLRVTDKPLREGDLVIVAGYPGKTSTLALASEIDEIIRVTYPRRIAMYQAYIAAIERVAGEDPEVRIKATGFIRRFNNFLTKHRGELEGLTRFRVLEQKRENEATLRAFVARNDATGERSLEAFDALERALSERAERLEADTALVTEVLQARLLYAATIIARMAEERQKPEAERALEYQDRKQRDLRDQLATVDQQYHRRLDQSLLTLALERLLATEPSQRSKALELLAGAKPSTESIHRAVDQLYRTTKLADPKLRLELFDSATPATLSRSKDPLIRAALALLPELHAAEDRRQRLNGAFLAHGPRYAEALLAKTGGLVAPDANGTLRLSYGRVHGPEGGGPAFTRVAEILGKHRGAPPFDAPARLREAAPSANETAYASTALGDVPADFLSDTKITNGNSGSATLDAGGKLTGLAFDGTFDSVVSDFVRIDATRSIHVDIRYALWVLDAVERADELLTELGVKPSLH